MKLKKTIRILAHGGRYHEAKSILTKYETPCTVKKVHPR